LLLRILGSFVYWKKGAVSALCITAQKYLNGQVLKFAVKAMQLPDLATRVQEIKQPKLRM